MSDQYGVRDAACPLSTREGGGVSVGAVPRRAKRQKSGTPSLGAWTRRRVHVLIGHAASLIPY